MQETMCRRSGTIGTHNVQEMKEHDRELEHEQQKMCKRTGKVQERQGNVQETLQEIRNL